VHTSTSLAARPIRPLARSRISAAALLVKVMAAMRCGLQPSLDQAPNFVGDDAGFARTGTGQHQARAVHVIDGFLLGQVEAVRTWGIGERGRQGARRERRIIPGGTLASQPAETCQMPAAGTIRPVLNILLITFPFFCAGAVRLPGGAPAHAAAGGHSGAEHLRVVLCAALHAVPLWLP
jgi:hypothetical protein